MAPPITGTIAQAGELFYTNNYINMSFRFRTDSGRRTKAEKLLAVLSDHHWHATRELTRRVGHTFAVAKFKLVRQHGYHIERERHPRNRNQHQYRLPPERIIS